MDWRNRFAHIFSVGEETCQQRFTELLSGDGKKTIFSEKKYCPRIHWANIGVWLWVFAANPEWRRRRYQICSELHPHLHHLIHMHQWTTANVPFNTWKGNNAYHQSKIWRKGCQVVANVTQSDHLSTDPGLSYECAPNGHFGKYICAHYLQALNTFLDISNYMSRLFTDSKYGVNRRSGMDLERLGHWMLLEPTSHLYIVAASVRAVLGTGQYRSFRSLQG